LKESLRKEEIADSKNLQMFGWR